MSRDRNRSRSRPAAGSSTPSSRGDHPAANPVGFNLAAQWPTETVTGDPLGPNENTNPNAITTAPLADKADMWTIKFEHRFTDMSSLSGLYIGNTTDEPGASSMPEEFGYFDPGSGSASTGPTSSCSTT